MKHCSPPGSLKTRPRKDGMQNKQEKELMNNNQRVDSNNCGYAGLWWAYQTVRAELDVNCYTTAVTWLPNMTCLVQYECLWPGWSETQRRCWKWWRDKPEPTNDGSHALAAGAGSIKCPFHARHRKAWTSSRPLAGSSPFLMDYHCLHASTPQIMINRRQIKAPYTILNSLPFPPR